MKTTTDTARPTRLWVRILKYFAITLVVLLIAALVLEALLKWRDRVQLPMPGEMISIGSHRMHWWCEGERSGNPTVVLDAGAIAFSTSWRNVIPRVANHTRVCAFDRSGLGWSEAGPGPWDGDQAAQELAALLDAAGETKPVIYVGHSLGAMLGRIFASHYPERLAGLLLLEPADPEIIVRDLNEERETPLTADMPDAACGMRCPLAAAAGLTGIPRWMLNSQEILEDPNLPRLAVEEFIARTVATDNLLHLVQMGRYFPRIFYQTLDNRSLGDIPLIMGYGTQSGKLLGDHESEEEWQRDYEESLAAWEASGTLSSNFLGMRGVEGANHLSLVTYPEYAAAVAAMIDELILAASDNGRKTANP